MQIAVISDIHGNRLALEAVLDDIERRDVDMVLNLGDNLAGPMDPTGVCDLLMAADYPSVRGNHDRFLIEPSPGPHFGPVDAFVLQTLDMPQLTWLAQLPPTLSIPDVFLCHGTPQSDMEPWLDDWRNGRVMTLPDEAAVAGPAEGLDFPVLLCGHTHLPRAVRLSDGRLIVNPGSVGLQFDHGSPDARYALIERRGEAWSVTHRVVPYDFEGAARQAEANGFPAWREALTGGWAGPAKLFNTPRAA